MRIRYILSLLTILLAEGATPLHAALGDAPMCLPLSTGQTVPELAEANPLALELRRAQPFISPEDRDHIIRTIVFEASGESEEGKAAVAHVILNRVRTGRWGITVKDVVTHPWQFEPWMTKRTQIETLSPSDPSYRDAARIADGVLSGAQADPTAGATHFLNPTIVRKRRGGTLPAWAEGDGQPIGNHTFFRPEEDGLVPESVLSPSTNAAYLVAERGGISILRAKQMPDAAGTDRACEQEAQTAESTGLLADLVQLDATGI